MQVPNNMGKRFEPDRMAGPNPDREFLASRVPARCVTHLIADGLVSQVSILNAMLNHRCITASTKTKRIRRHSNSL